MKNDRIENIRRQIRSLEREIFEQFKETSCCGVSLAQCHAVLEIGDSHASNISDLAERLKLDKSTLSRTIEGLVQLNLVSREINSEDRRYMRITLTQTGNRVYRSINKFCNQYYQTVFDQIPEEKQSQIIEGLKILAEAMQRAREKNEAEIEQSVQNIGLEENYENRI